MNPPAEFDVDITYAEGVMAFGLFVAKKCNPT
jgi:hypothetical protein